MEVLILTVDLIQDFLKKPIGSGYGLYNGKYWEKKEFWVGTLKRVLMMD